MCDCCCHCPPDDDRLVRHHWKPRSRRGTKDHTVRIPKGFHEAWHVLFHNLTLDESLEMVEKLAERFRKGQQTTTDDLNSLRLECRQ